MQHCGLLERRNAIGIWSSRFVTLTSEMQKVEVGVADKEGQPPTLKIVVTNVARPEPNLITFISKTAEELTLKAANNDVADEWYAACRGFLEKSGILEPKNAGLPANDPRNGLKFVDIPGGFIANFSNLERAVLYWFDSIKKFGAVNVLTKRHKIEDRVGFLGDKAFYVTRPNSEITRCIKVEKLACLYTNAGTSSLPQGQDPFLVLKVPHPEYDLCFESAQVLQLVKGLKAVYRQVTRGKDLRVCNVSSYSEAAVALQLERPDAYEMTMVVPSTKKQLRRGLEKYYQQRGLPMPTAQPSPDRPRSSPTPTDGNGGSSPASVAQKDEEAERVPAVPMTDPLGCFLTLVGLPHLYLTLYKQHLDLDLLDCLDETDFKNFGVTEDADIDTIRSKCSDAEFLSEVHKTVEDARKGGSWGAKAPAAVAVTPTPPNPSPVAPSSRPQQQQSMEVTLSDDDDLADLMPASAARGINLDSDDDLPVAPASPPPAAAATIDLDDDDL